MINIITTLKTTERDLMLFDKINEVEHNIELNCLMNSLKDEELCKSLLYGPPIDILVYDTSAHPYVIYSCKIVSTRYALGFESVIAMKGTFSRLVQEEQVNKRYDTAIFAIIGLEKIFPLERFDTEFEDETDNLKFIKEKSKIYECVISDDLTCEVISDFDGVVSSVNLFELKVKQQKAIKLSFKDRKSKNEIVNTILKIKQYFEFLTKQELQICDVKFYNLKQFDKYNGHLLYDKILEPNTKTRPLKDNPYRDTFDNLFIGLTGWMSNYDTYYRVINIWQKTIYNTNVADEDIFIWYCQAFELLCTLNKDVYEESKKFKEPDQSYPNIKNFLQATRDLYGIFKGLNDNHFMVVKDIRDKLTHNNPKKNISKIQTENSLQLIEFFFYETLQNIMNITGIPHAVMLKENKQ